MAAIRPMRIRSKTKKKTRNNFGLRVKHVSPKETGLLLSAWQSVAVTLWGNVRNYNQGLGHFYRWWCVIPNFLAMWLHFGHFIFTCHRGFFLHFSCNEETWVMMTLDQNMLKKSSIFTDVNKLTWKSNFWNNYKKEKKRCVSLRVVCSIH